MRQFRILLRSVLLCLLLLGFLQLAKHEIEPAWRFAKHSGFGKKWVVNEAGIVRMDFSIFILFFDIT
jgi:hypothetical protein